MAAPPADVEVNPGKLTWMTAGWGSERFTVNYSTFAGSNFARILHGWLIAANEKSELLPGIATKWEMSPDGKTWTFTIRDGVRFHDGKEITAEDVWWTWMHYWGKDESGSAVARSNAVTAQVLARVTERIEITGPNQVSWTGKSPDASFAITYASESDSQWWGVLPGRPKVHDDAQEASYDENPVGAGPGKLVRHVPADLMAFERFNDFYYQPKNGFPEDRRLKFKSLDLRLVPEESTRVAALRSGEADIVPASLQTKEQVEAGGGRIVFAPEGIYVRWQYHGCWDSQYPCHDKRVRHALDYVIDKELIRDTLYGGPEAFQVKGWNLWVPSTIGYSPDIDPFPYDPDKARQLLADAGYPGGEGFGKLILNTYVSSSAPFLAESGQLAADMWRRELGLDVEVRLRDETDLKRARTRGDLHGEVMWTDGSGTRDRSRTFLSGYGDPDNPARVHNDPEIFELVKQTLAVLDPIKREEAQIELAKRLREESYESSIGYNNIPWGVGPRVLTWQPWPMAAYPSALHTITLK
jgi:peptide/nickel transport system substrate-binding protein